METKKKPRIVFDLTRHQYAQTQWLLMQRGRTMVIDSDGSKAALVKRSVARCNQILAEGGRAQLVVHGKDGKIQTEHTYGDDPRRTKG